MMKSKICDLFGIEYPIVQGGMQWLAVPEFAAEVSNAGGLGTLNSSLYTSKEELREGIRRLRSLTDKPFALNISMLPVQVAGEMTNDFLAVAAEEKVPVVELAGRDPKPYVPMLKEAGVKVIHKSTAIRFAKKAEAAGVDAVSIVGFECGGHPGMDDVSTMVLIPSVVDAVSVPVIAGGGICDSRSYLAARALGAEGVVMGTRFVATNECLIHQNFKQLFVDLDERSTAIVQRSIKNASRDIKNETIKQLMELENSSDHPLTLQEILPFVNGKRQRQAYLSGDVGDGAIPAGECIGRIHDILSVKEVIEEIAVNSEKIIASWVNR
ncbi:NAD(P)H-dependent flavin oxidoreductase [Caproiciproducens sp. NJN-50]|uniref:NAD(P)H-dependent flavin oxidoreductase n=1 Tax=Caproiciproducens sp. NJN-50 TaxID=2507162 RepID=UPI001FA9542A|nr:nitronate monooxygenase [Caproiciproducens sp. NJN-50]